ncbi:MAG: hypothetical protein JOY86_09240 [Candidatus Eremiobacteraeota bacterium]|nr:hypothetical protein [Candidatus Eremiobacteraeota bacterium]
MLSVQEARGTAGIQPVKDEPPAKIHVDPPLADQLRGGRVVIPYYAENLRIVPVYGPAALEITPRVGHIHVTVDDAPWHWLDSSGEPVILNGFPPGPHKVLIQLVNAIHVPLDQAVVEFTVPAR